MQRERADGGFTLVEIMVAVTCMALLGAVAVPRLQGYVLQSRLNAAKPYLMEIAARERMYRAETGSYCCTAYGSFSEDTLASNLGLSLSEAGDFCFLFLCQNVAANSATGTPASTCEKPSASPGYIVPASTGDAAPQFEVWAILRSDAGSSVSGPGSTTCTVSTTATSPKLPSTGWVLPATSTASAGRAGQVVALRYPPPQNGPSSGTGTYHRGVTFLWQDGVSGSDAQFP